MRERLTRSGQCGAALVLLMLVLSISTLLASFTIKAMGITVFESRTTAHSVHANPPTSAEAL